jgi:2-keto-4-pentenoate hydratase/2-oxohepta-3-ene-1,7-dioic acid hydratase in catechol pathway
LSRILVALLVGVLAACAGAEAGQTSAANDPDGTQYVRYEQGGTISWGVLEGDQIHQLSNAPYLDGSRTGRTVQRSAVTLKAPVDPRQVYMTALNFRSHISGEPAAYPGIFSVPANSIIGPDEPMIRPVDSNNFHYEAEAVVVIGRAGENIPMERAHEYIFGVSAGNDGSARDWQRDDLQWTRAKGSKTFNPVGPVLVKGADYSNLEIVGRLNGEERQRENTSDMLFDFDHMVSYISRYFPLEAGDIIWSGTMGTTRAMQPGDVYEVEIEGLMVLRNPIEQGK